LFFTKRDNNAVLCIMACNPKSKQLLFTGSRGLRLKHLILQRGWPSSQN
jgi:hypothetical protein